METNKSARSIALDIRSRNLGISAEPDDERAKTAGNFARRAIEIGRKVFGPAKVRPANLTHCTQQLAVHVQDVFRACALVQIVDILSDDGDARSDPRETRLELRECDVRRVRLD